MNIFGVQLFSRVLKINLPVYYTIYPSKRSKGAFVCSQDTFLLSLFKGSNLLFEKELPLSEPISYETIDLIHKFIL